jgi:surfeit locus 1 family protein
MIAAVATLPARRLRRLVWPGLMALAMFAVLVALGTWQLHRLAWKEGILARIAAAERAPAVALPAQPSPFEKVRVSGRLRNDLTAWFGAEVRDTRAGPELGAQLIQPLERAGAPPVLVDRGWLPQPAPPLPEQPGETSIDGYVRLPEHPGWFSAADDPAERRFYTLDPAAIGAALGLKQVAPFVLVALGPETGALPDPAHHLPQPPNNHLNYALTWYALALGLVLVFGSWARSVLRA